MRRPSDRLSLALLIASFLVAAGSAAADPHYIDVQYGGPGTVTPSGAVEVPAGGSQTFTFTPSGCNVVADVQVDDASVGAGLTSYTFTNVQSDHSLYVAFGLRSTTTALSVLPTAGQCAVPETLTATVANSDGGQVQFFNGANLLATRSLASGTASYIVASGLATGSYALSANYLGTSCSSSSSSPTVMYDVADTGPVPMTLALVSSEGTNVPLTGSTEMRATLMLGGSVAMQSGQVTFYDGGIAIGTVAMVNGYAARQVHFDALGNHVMTAVAQLSLCTSTVTSAPVTVYVEDSRTPTTTSLSITPGRADVGASVTLRATLNFQLNTGLVHFVDITNGAVDLGTASVGNGNAQFTYGPLSGTGRTLMAYYGGDANYQPSASAPGFLEIGPPLAAPPSLFHAPVDKPTGARPYAVAAADLNADGRPDVVTANHMANTVSILLATASGFNPHFDYAVGSNPTRVAIADVNADGKPDIVVATDNGASVLLANGGGTFAPRTDFGSACNAVAVADLNGDGRPDLVVTHLAPSTVSVLLGNGDGTFGPATDLAAGTHPEAVAVADVNGDGRLDLVVGDDGDPVSPGPSVAPIDSSYVSVLLGNGNGTFGPRTGFGCGRDPSALAIADLNADGRPDLATVNSGPDGIGLSASVLLGNGDGSFAAHNDYGVGGYAYGLAIADLDADGKLDLAVAGLTVSVMLGNGDGTFGARATYGSGSYTSIAIADFDEDGLPDLAAASTVANTMSEFVHINEHHVDIAFSISPSRQETGESVTLTATAIPSTATGPVRFYDVTNDSVVATVPLSSGTASFVYGPLIGGNRLMEARYDGDGFYTPNTSNQVLLEIGAPPPPPPPAPGAVFFAPTSYQTGLDPYAVATGDFNEDGHLDLVTANFSSGTAVVLLGNGDGTFTYNGGTYPLRDTHPQYVAVADFNMDGHLDLVAGGSILPGNGDGTFGPKIDYAAFGGAVAVGDLNGDGRPDVALAYSAGGVGVLLGNGNGTFAQTNVAAGQTPLSVAIADLNGDGRLDLVVGDRGKETCYGHTCLDSSYVSVLLGNGNGTFQPRLGFDCGMTPEGVTLGDVNADGIPDIVTANYGADFGSNTVSELLGNGDGTFKPHQEVTAESSPSAVAIDDFTLDGKLDLAVVGGNSVAVLAGNSTGAFSSPTTFGSGPYSDLVVGDFNSDGLPDLAATKAYVAVVDVFLHVPRLVNDVPPSAAITASALSRIAPNPARAASQIEYAVARAGHVRLQVTDVTGRVVATLFDGVQQPGRFQVAWDGSARGERLAAGIYFVRLTTPDRTVTRKIARLP